MPEVRSGRRAHELSQIAGYSPQLVASPSFDGFGKYRFTRAFFCS